MHAYDPMPIVLDKAEWDLFAMQKDNQRHFVDFCLLNL